MLHLMESGNHAEDIWDRNTQSAETKSHNQKHDVIIVAFCIIGTEGSHLLTEANEVIEQQLVETLHDCRFFLITAILFNHHHIKAFSIKHDCMTKTFVV